MHAVQNSILLMVLWLGVSRDIQCSRPGDSDSLVRKLPGTTVLTNDHKYSVEKEEEEVDASKLVVRFKHGAEFNCLNCDMKEMSSPRKRKRYDEPDSLATRFSPRIRKKYEEAVSRPRSPEAEELVNIPEDACPCPKCTHSPAWKRMDKVDDKLSCSPLWGKMLAFLKKVYGNRKDIGPLFAIDTPDDEPLCPM